MGISSFSLSRTAYYTHETLSNTNLWSYRGPSDSYLHKLPYAAQAAFNSSDKRHDPLCLPNTRVGVLEQIMAWADGRNERCIFWLNGVAGTGKSTIARTVARKYDDQKRLGASFFFSRGGEDVNHAGKFFTSIAVQLASKLFSLKRYICEVIKVDNGIASQTPRDQWNKLILEPLSKLETDSLQLPLILVIDALDECEGENDIREIIQLLAEVKSLKTIQLRIFITSRPEIPIRPSFRAMSEILHQDLVLNDISRAIVDQDIFIFFTHKLSEIRNASEDLPVNWPGKKTIDLLVLKAHGLFIYAATVCRFIKEGGEQWPPQDLLDLVLSEDGASGSLLQKPGERVATHKSPTKELDEIYTQALEYSFKTVHDEWDKRQLAGVFRQVIGAIIVLFEPLSTTALAGLLTVRKEIVNRRLRHLRSVLDVPENHNSIIRLLHPSFRDFLLDKQRCHNQHFWVDEKKTHKALTESCLRLISSCLKRDICDLQMPGVLIREVERGRVEQYLPAHVQYACRYWVDYLTRSNISLCDDGQIHKFIQEHFLHWLEALSLIGKISEGVFMITMLQSLLTVSDLVLSRYDLRC
jgi:hypothetical protein